MRKQFIAFALSCVLQHTLPTLTLHAALPPDGVLTNISQVLALTAQEAAEELPVRLTASVTYANRTGALLFIQDQTDGIFVGLENRMPALRYGQVVEVRGRTDPGIHLRAVRDATLQLFDEIRAPLVKPTTPAQLMAGADDCDLTSVQGVVRAMGKHNGQTTLMVNIGDDQWVEAIFVDGKGLSNLWDATVRLRGVAGLRSMKAGNVASLAFYCWDRRAVTVEKPGIYDPFVGRKINVSQALRETNAQRRICLSGRFVAETGDELIVEDDAAGRIAVMASRPLLLRTNDRVQASGFVRRRDGTVTLEDPQLRIMALRRATNSTMRPSESPLFTSITDIRHDRSALSAPGAPVRVRAVVTFYDGGWMFFVQDQTEGIFVASKGQKLPVAAGQLVEIEGFTDPGDYAPIIVEPRIKVLGGSVFPSAKAVRYDELMRGREDSQRVEISGVVRSVTPDKNGAILDLAVLGGRIKTFLFLRGQPLPVHFIDAAVRVRGVCGSYFNDRRQFTGVQLYVAGLSDIDIDDPAPEDAFAGAPQPTSNLLQFGSAASRRVKVSGTVTLSAPEKGLLVLQDASGGVVIHGNLPEKIDLGDRVEVAGFPTTGGYTPTLSEAIVRRTGTAAVVYPRAVQAEDAMSGNYDGELITIEGRLLEQFAREGNMVLVVQSGRLVFEARLDEQAWRASRVSIERQSSLRLTGICSVQVNQSLTPRGFKLLLRSGRDVTVLSSPPWWTDPRVRVLIGSAALLAAAAITCVWLLRRKIREQTAVIRRQLEREQRVNDQLEAKVQVRTAELIGANASLQEARNELELRVAARTSELSALNKTLTEEIAVRRQTEEAMRLGEERFQLLARATNDVIRDWDVKADRIWWSDAFESSFGHSRIGVEPGTESWTRRMHPEDRDRVETGMRQAISNGAVSWTEEYRFGHADGSYRYVLDRGYVIRNQAGEPVRMVGAMTDMTERRKAEELLRLSEERFSKAFHGSPVPMAISTVTEGRYIDVNEALLELLGFARDEVIGRCSTELGIWRHPEQRARMVEALRENKLIRDMQVELCTRSGEGRHVLGSAETIQLKGEPCIIAIFNDLTPRLHLEAQLRQAQKMEAVGQLAAGIAHDFNNILTVVQGHVGLLLASVGGPQDRSSSSLQEIGNAADRAANLTRQLLTFSRRQPVQSRLLDVNEVIGGMSTMLRRLLGEQITLHYQQAPALPSVRADQGMLEQVIMNLAVNARDAMPEGGSLTFETMPCVIDEEYGWRNPEAKAGRFVRITVADNGCGMSAATLSRVFEPFFTTKEVGKGTGLGLATVYGILKQHEGWIEVTSEPNRGTTFQIYLPEQESAPLAAALPAGDLPVRGGTETILLVEDEPGVRRLAENILSRHGYQVICASDGREALDVWKRNAEQIDLLLTDMVMPQGISGLQLAGELRTSSPHLKVIYTSGYSVELAESELGLHEGVNFLPKPYPARELAAVVRNCLDV